MHAFWNASSGDRPEIVAIGIKEYNKAPFARRAAEICSEEHWYAAGAMQT
jgi:hypothetical protein